MTTAMFVISLVCLAAIGMSARTSSRELASSAVMVIAAGTLCILSIVQFFNA